MPPKDDQTDSNNEAANTDEWGNPTSLTADEPSEQLPDDAPAADDPAPTPAEPAAPAFDPAALVSDIDAKLARTKDEIIEAVKPPAPEPTPEEKAEWKPEKWQDFEELAEKKAQEIYRQQREQEKAEEERIAAEAKAEEERINSAFDNMVNELESDGMLPKVTNPEDPEDPGRKARAELYAYASSLGTLDLKAAGTQLKQLHDSGFTFDPKSSKLLRSNPRPAGLDAPVGSSSKATPAPRAAGLDIRNMSWDELARRAKDDFLRT